jgi:hypothetical protein
MNHSSSFRSLWLVTAYFDSKEQILETIDDLKKRATQIRALGTMGELRFYWRGKSNAAWGVHSSLHRALAARDGLGLDDIDQVSDEMVVQAERGIIAEARDWIRPSVGARLTTVDLMARLQHAGMATRLIDFTSDPLVALHFAVAQDPSEDGRLIIAAARGVPSAVLRNSFVIPWRSGVRSRPIDWAEQLYALDDQLDFLRIIRQHGAFLTGGTPSTRPQRRLGSDSMRAAEVRRSMSIPLALHSWSQAESVETGSPVRGRPPTVASALTLRVPSGNKTQLQKGLSAMNVTWSSLFPDPEGLRLYGERVLVSPSFPAI